jgi:gluconolactonase
MPGKFLLPIALAAMPAVAQTIVSLPDSLYSPGDTVAWIKRLPHYCEGPVWDSTTGSIYFSQIDGDDNNSSNPDWPIWKIRPGIDTGSRFVTTGQSNGLALDPRNGKLVAAQNGRIARFNANGTLDSVLAQSSSELSISGANDISFGANGAFYFTNLGIRVFHVNAAGVRSSAYAGTTQSANGI